MTKTYRQFMAESHQDYLKAKLAAVSGPRGIKNGTIKHSSEIDFTGDLFNRSHEKDPGHYVHFGMWKGPFPSAQVAKDAYDEWAWESKHS